LLLEEAFVAPSQVMSQASYFAGDVVPNDFEAEFQLGIRGNSTVFKLTKQYIYNADCVSVYFEVLLRGGGRADTAPYQRLMRMTDEEGIILLDTTVRMFGSSGNATMNVLNLTGVHEYAESGMIIEIHDSLLKQVTPEMLALMGNTRVWADDVPIDDESAVLHVLDLVPLLDAVKIGTMDCAIAFDLPIVKNPIDKPDIVFKPPHNQALQHKILMFAAMAHARNPALKFILELAVPLEEFTDKGIPRAQLFIQGGPYGARVYVDATPHPVEEAFAVAVPVAAVAVVVAAVVVAAVAAWLLH
jgi:hypothetical protein